MIVKSIYLGVIFCVSFLIVAVSANAVAAEEASGVPKWVQNWVWKGDVRVRQEWLKPDPGEDRSRQRLRMRFGFEATVTENVKAGGRLVTGGDSVTSTNQTLDDAFEHIDAAFDLGYIEYSTDWLTLDGGIFKKPFYATSDLVWDSDVTFQGAAAEFEIGVGESTTPFAVLGAFPLEEISSSQDDPWLAAVQAGVKSQISETVSVGVGVTYYDFRNIEGAVLEHRKNTNTNLPVAEGEDGDTAFATEFEVVEFNGEVEMEVGGIPLALVGDIVNNTSVDDDDTGWLVGIRLGSKKVKKKGQWRAYYNYRVLEKDCFIDIFPDADPLGGGTNLNAHEIILDYGLLDNVVLSLDYYSAQAESGPEKDRDTIELDVVVKF